MADPTRDEMLRSITADQIEASYRAGNMSSYDHSQLMREKASSMLKQGLEDNGYLWAILRKTIDHANESWDAFVKSASEGVGTENVWTNLANEGASAWHAVSIALSPLMAFGEVNGMQVERAFLAGGARPGLARLANIVADIGSGFIPVGVLARSFARTVQGIQKGVGAIKAVPGATSAAKGASGAIDLGEASFGKEREIAAAKYALEESLKVEGVDITQVAKPFNWVPPGASSGIVGEAGKTGASAITKEVKGLGTVTVSKARPRDATFLPADLANAKPRYNIGTSEFIPQFESQMDKALFILAQTKPSKRDADYMSAVKNYFQTRGIELSDEVIRMMGRKVHDRIKNIAKNSEVGEITIPRVTNIGETARTAKASLQEQVSTIAKTVTEEQAREGLAALTKKTGVNPNGLATAKQLSVKETYAYLTILGREAEDLPKLARAALAGGEPEQIAFAKRAIELFTDTPVGDRITYTKQFTDMLLHWDPDSMARGDISGAMTTLAKDILALSKPIAGGGVEASKELIQLIAKSQDGFARYGAGWWPKAREVYLNVMLPFAWAPTFVGNIIATGVSVMERATGAIFKTSEKGLVNKEAMYQTKGMVLAMGDILKAFKQSYKRAMPLEAENELRALLAQGIKPEKALQQVVEKRPGLLEKLIAAEDEAHRFDYVQGAIGGIAGRIINQPTDLVRGMDNIFKMLAKRGVYYANAMREADQLALKGAARAEHIKFSMEYPTEATFAEAENLARLVSFQTDLGPIASWFKKIQTGPGVLYFPFMKSFINLTKWGWDRTPGLQLISRQLYKDIAEGGVKADMAVGRLTVSNLWSMFAFELAKDGFITGSGPVDPALRKAWLATHTPYAVKTPSDYMPIGGLDPASNPLGMIADFTQIIDQLDEPTAQQIGAAIVFSTLKNFANSSWITTGSDLVDVIQGMSKGEPIGEKSLKVLLSPGTTVLTGGPIGSRIAHALDPVQRDTRTVIDNAMSKVAGYSQTVPAARDGYGDVIIPPQPFGGSWFGLLKPIVPAFKPFELDKLKLLGDNLQAKLPNMPTHIGGTMAEGSLREPLAGDVLGVELTPQNQERWWEIYRQMIRDPEHGIDSMLLENPVFKEGTRALKRQLFNSTLGNYFSAAGERLKLENGGELQKKIMDNEAKSVLPLVQEADRPAVQQQLEEGKKLFDQMAPQSLEMINQWWPHEEGTE